MRRLIAGLIAAIAGATVAQAQSPAPPPNTALDAYAKPQRPVTVADGRRIHLYCQGRGAPTVIFTAGLGGWAIAWAKVQPAVAKHTRTCAWDRAGFGHSDGSPQTQTLAATTDDLEQALAAARIKGPYVLVGHSAGAFETLRFADRHRGDVAGIVLVDPSVPDQSTRFATISADMAKAQASSMAMSITFQRRCAKGLEDGTIKPDDGVWKACFRYGPDVSTMLAGALTERDRQPGRFAAKASLAEQFGASAAAVADPARNYGDQPLIVLTQGTGLGIPGATTEQTAALNTGWIGWHDDYAKLSTRGVNLIVRGAGHNIQAEKPQAVIGAIVAVLDEASAR
jgi:pimeloyl-ACP methyl ester carboxylesterase